MLEFIIIYGFVELMCMGNIIWYELKWILMNWKVFCYEFHMKNDDNEFTND
jgi:hypothetical protein